MYAQVFRLRRKSHSLLDDPRTCSYDPIIKQTKIHKKGSFYFLLPSVDGAGGRTSLNLALVKE